MDGLSTYGRHARNQLKGSMTTMLADFLVDASGVIRVAHYRKDEGDHLPFDEVKKFAMQQK